MADKNDAREWWLKHRARFVYEKFDGRREYSQLNEVAMLTAYAAAVTQERDALRRALKSRIMDYEPYIAPLREEQKHLDPNTPERAYWHYGYSSALADVLHQLEARAAAEESQPK